MGLAWTNEGPFTMTSGEALVADRFVLTSSSTAIYADAGEEPVGLTLEPVATATPVSIAPLTGGISKVTGSKGIDKGAKIYMAADGKVSDFAIGKQIGILLAAITADGGKGPAVVWGPRGGQSILSELGLTCEYFDDFFTFDDGDDYIDTVSDAGTIETTDAANGVLSIAVTAVDNNESYVSSDAEIFCFQTDKNLYFEARVKLTESNTDDANIIVGLSDTVAANSLLDTGGGPMASYDGAVFFKIDGGTVWQFETSNAGTQKTLTSAGAFTDKTWTTLGFLYDYNDGVTANVTPFIDGVAGTAQTLVISGLLEMHILLGLKAGSGVVEALLVDYVHVVTER